MTSITNQYTNTVEGFYDNFVSQISVNTITPPGASTTGGVSSAMSNTGEYIFIGDCERSNVYVYTSDNTNVSYLTTIDLGTTPGHGWSVDTDLYGDTVVIGSNLETVSVYTRSGSSFTHDYTISKPSANSSDFGKAVAIAKENTSRIVVGDYGYMYYYYNGDTLNCGDVSLFENGTLIANWHNLSSGQGVSVGISGDGEYIVTGHGGYSSPFPYNTTMNAFPYVDGGGTHHAAGDGVFQILKYDTNAGSTINGNNITRKKYLYAPISNSSYGFSVAMSVTGDIVAVGAPTENLNSANGYGGAIRVYQKSAVNDTTWNQIGNTIYHSKGAGNLLRLTYNGKRLYTALQSAAFKDDQEDYKTFNVYDYNGRFWTPLEYIEGEFFNNSYGYPTSMSLDGLKILCTSKNNTNTNLEATSGISDTKQLLKLASGVKLLGSTSVGGSLAASDIIVGGGVVSNYENSGMITFSDTTGDEDKFCKILNRKYDGQDSTNDKSELLIMKNGDDVGGNDRIRMYGYEVVLQSGGSLVERDCNNEIFEDGYEFMCDPAIKITSNNCVNIGELSPSYVSFIVTEDSGDFLINGKNVDLVLQRGVEYRFDQSDSSNTDKTIMFYNGGTPLGSNTSILPGNLGAYTTITIPYDAPETGIESVNWNTGTTHTNIGVISPPTRLNVTGNMNVSGLVGIGTSSPQHKLQVGGNVSLGSYSERLFRPTHYYYQTYSGTSGYAYHFLEYNNTWVLHVNGNDKMYIRSDTGVALDDFTGQHRSFVENVWTENINDYIGLIVCANKNTYTSASFATYKGNRAIQINESLPDVRLSNVAYDKSCFGVISSGEDPESREDTYGTITIPIPKERGDTRTFINSVGEGAIWVTNINGSLESGDYITTSNIVGYGQKQDSEFLANYTVAKITMDCDFNPKIQPVKQIKKELGNVEYWIKYKIKVISQEEYNVLPDTQRRIKTNADGNDKYYQLLYEEKTIEDPLIYEIENYVWIHESREEMINSIDENGIFIWEDHPTETEKAYKIRYLDSNGMETDEANHVYKAAFVGCTYHCG